MKRNYFPYRDQKRFINDCKTYIRYRDFDNDNYNTQDDLNKFIKTIKEVYDFTENNLDIIYDKGLKYPTTYFLERLKYFIHKDRNKNILICMENSTDIINTYSSLFDKPRWELVNYFYNGILLYQYDKRLNLRQYDSSIDCHIDCNHHFIIDLDGIIDKCGIYKLYDDEQQLVYIGKSYTLGLRIQKSLKERNCKYYSYCIVGSKKKADIYELYYISKLKPKYNIKDIDYDISKFNVEELVFSSIKSNYPLCIDLDEVNNRKTTIKAYIEEVNQ